jgi:hypothetical protein
MRRWLACASALLVGSGCSARDVAPPSAATEIPATNLPSQEAVERDLALAIRRSSTEPIELGGKPPDLDVTVENRSATESYPIALTARKGMGWIEPAAWLIPGDGERVSDAVELVLENRSNGPLPFSTASGGASLYFMVGSGPERETDLVMFVDGGTATADAVETMAPGERRDALGGAALRPGSKLPPGYRPTRIRAVLRVGEKRVLSAWVPTASVTS